MLMKKEVLILVLCVAMVSLVLADYQAEINVADTEDEDDSEDNEKNVCEELNQTICDANSLCKYDYEDNECELIDEKEDDETKEIEEEYEIHEEYLSEEGEKIKIEKKIHKKLRLYSGNISAETEIEIEQETERDGIKNKTKLKVKLSNGRNAEIKIMPDTASERALERLRLKVCSEENNCTIDLKEVGQGNETRPAYEVQAERHSRILGLFQAKMQVHAQVDAETGEVIGTEKPWWAFLATEPEETGDENTAVIEETENNETAVSE
jgi:hypothetical protein